MVEFLAVVGALAICALIFVAVTSAVGGIDGALMRIAAIEKRLDGHRDWSFEADRRIAAACDRLKKLEDAIGPPEPTQ